MYRTRTIVAPVAGVALVVVLAACGDVVPGFYSEDGERQALVDDCVEYIQIAAYSGDVTARGIWDETGQDAAVLADACDGLADSDPAKLDEYRKLLRASERQARETGVDGTRANVLVATDGENCNPDYRGICLPLEEDVDCLPGDGDGPWFLERTVIIVGDDTFELDTDGDGLGCEPDAYIDA